MSHFEKRFSQKIRLSVYTANVFETIFNFFGTCHDAADAKNKKPSLFLVLHYQKPLEGAFSIASHTMRQLLEISEEYAIVGLGDRVFVGHLDQEDKNIYELVLVVVDAATTGAPNNTAAGSDVNPREVQAVAILKTDDYLVCAVSCLNKNLLVFQIDLSPTSGALEADQRDPYHHRTIQPTTVHKTSKRAGCLCFARVPGENDAESRLTVVIAGDASGDAVAFPLVASCSKQGSSAPSKDTPPPSEQEGDENAIVDEATIQNQRVLLGHTASMLTGVKVVQDESSCRILTSDRDEKVRISSFPNAFLIQGYLLGHEAFVSSMDVSQVDGVTRCITCSGDGTVRLWDYTSCQELSSLCVTEDGSRVPSRVCMNASATLAVVAFDESPRLDILQIEDNIGNLKVLATMECSAPTLALAMMNDDKDTLVVLLTEAPFLCAYQLRPSDTKSPDAVKIPFARALNEFLLATQPEGTTLGIPTTVLEKDQNGKLMLKTNREKRGPAFVRPWDNAERKVIAKERERRYKQQKQENKKIKRAKHDAAVDS